jgi:hypothetical protein
MKRTLGLIACFLSLFTEIDGLSSRLTPHEQNTAYWVAFALLGVGCGLLVIAQATSGKGDKQ